MSSQPCDIYDSEAVYVSKFSTPYCNLVEYSYYNRSTPKYNNQSCRCCFPCTRQDINHPSVYECVGKEFCSFCSRIYPQVSGCGYLEDCAVANSCFLNRPVCHCCKRNYCPNKNYPKTPCSLNQNPCRTENCLFQTDSRLNFCSAPNSFRSSNNYPITNPSEAHQWVAPRCSGKNCSAFIHSSNEHRCCTKHRFKEHHCLSENCSATSNSKICKAKICPETHKPSAKSCVNLSRHPAKKDSKTLYCVSKNSNSTHTISDSDTKSLEEHVCFTKSTHGTKHSFVKKPLETPFCLSTSCFEADPSRARNCFSALQRKSCLKKKHCPNRNLQKPGAVFSRTFCELPHCTRKEPHLHEEGYIDSCSEGPLGYHTQPYQNCCLRSKCSCCTRNHCCVHKPISSNRKCCCTCERRTSPCCCTKNCKGFQCCSRVHQQRSSDNLNHIAKVVWLTKTRSGNKDLLNLQVEIKHSDKEVKLNKSSISFKGHDNKASGQTLNGNSANRSSSKVTFGSSEEFALAHTAVDRSAMDRSSANRSRSREEEGLSFQNSGRGSDSSHGRQSRRDIYMQEQSLRKDTYLPKENQVLSQSPSLSQDRILRTDTCSLQGNRPESFCRPESTNISQLYRSQEDGHNTERSCSTNRFVANIHSADIDQNNDRRQSYDNRSSVCDGTLQNARTEGLSRRSSLKHTSFQEQFQNPMAGQEIAEVLPASTTSYCFKQHDMYKNSSENVARRSLNLGSYILTQPTTDQSTRFGNKRVPTDERIVDEVKNGKSKRLSIDKRTVNGENDLSKIRQSIATTNQSSYYPSLQPKLTSRQSRKTSYRINLLRDTPEYTVAHYSCEPPNVNLNGDVCCLEQPPCIKQPSKPTAINNCESDCSDDTHDVTSTYMGDCKTKFKKKLRRTFPSSYCRYCPCGRPAKCCSCPDSIRGAYINKNERSPRSSTDKSTSCRSSSVDESSQSPDSCDAEVFQPSGFCGPGPSRASQSSESSDERLISNDETEQDCCLKSERRLTVPTILEEEKCPARLERGLVSTRTPDRPEDDELSARLSMRSGKHCVSIKSPSPSEKYSTYKDFPVKLEKDVKPMESSVVPKQLSVSMYSPSTSDEYVTAPEVVETPSSMESERYSLSPKSALASTRCSESKNIFVVSGNNALSKQSSLNQDQMSSRLSSMKSDRCSILAKSASPSTRCSGSKNSSLVSSNDGLKSSLKSETLSILMRSPTTSDEYLTVPESPPKSEEEPVVKMPSMRSGRDSVSRQVSLGITEESASASLSLRSQNIFEVTQSCRRSEAGSVSGKSSIRSESCSVSKRSYRSCYETCSVVTKPIRKAKEEWDLRQTDLMNVETKFQRSLSRSMEQKRPSKKSHNKSSKSKCGSSRSCKMRAVTKPNKRPEEDWELGQSDLMNVEIKSQRSRSRSMGQRRSYRKSNNKSSKSKCRSRRLMKKISSCKMRAVTKPIRRAEEDRELGQSDLMNAKTKSQRSRSRLMGRRRSSRKSNNKSSKSKSGSRRSMKKTSSCKMRAVPKRSGVSSKCSTTFTIARAPSRNSVCTQYSVAPCRNSACTQYSVYDSGRCCKRKNCYSMRPTWSEKGLRRNSTVLSYCRLLTRTEFIILLLVMLFYYLYQTFNPGCCGRSC